MKRNISLPAILGIAVVLLALIAYYGYRTANRENEGVDLDVARKRQMEQRQRLTQPGTSSQDKTSAYGGK